MEKLTIATLALITEPLTRTETMVAHKHSFFPVSKSEKKFFQKKTSVVPPKKLVKRGTFYTERKPIISQKVLN